MDVRHASLCVGRGATSYRAGERAEIMGVGVIQIRAYVHRPCLLVRYPDGWENAVLFEDIPSGLYTLECTPQ
jgi:hypothetical protein